MRDSERRFCQHLFGVLDCHMRAWYAHLLFQQFAPPSLRTPDSELANQDRVGVRTITRQNLIIWTISTLLTLMPLEATGEKPSDGVARFNYVLGTQTFAPLYQFSDDTRLVETARAIHHLGSHVIKFDMSARAFRGYRLPVDDTIRSLRDMAAREPSCRFVLDMPFQYYLIWAYPHGVAHSPYHPWRNGLTDDARQREYRELYDLTSYLRNAYRGTGKTFFLGHWEGDWALLGSFNRMAEPTDIAIHGMIDWLNVRQKAVADARQATPSDVQVYHYTEVNLVLKAMEGKRTVTTSVLPHTSVDLVSYSSYDALAGGKEGMAQRLKDALDYIEDQLPPSDAVTGKRVFIGEYGFPLDGKRTPDEQDRLARRVAVTGLQWGCPLVLYWQMYDNERRDGQPRGFWMIDDQGREQPVYATHQAYFQRAKRYVADCVERAGQPPTSTEFARHAVKWLQPERKTTTSPPAR